jgi:hypothetical protein
MPAERQSGTAAAKVKGAKKVALDILRKAIEEAGQPAPTSNHIPPDSRTILFETWRQYAYAAGISEGDDPDSKRRTFVQQRKTCKSLV